MKHNVNNDSNDPQSSTHSISVLFFDLIAVEATERLLSDYTTVNYTSNQRDKRASVKAFLMIKFLLDAYTMKKHSSTLVEYYYGLQRKLASDCEDGSSALRLWTCFLSEQFLARALYKGSLNNHHQKGKLFNTLIALIEWLLRIALVTGMQNSFWTPLQAIFQTTYHRRLLDIGEQQQGEVSGGHRYLDLIKSTLMRPSTMVAIALFIVRMTSNNYFSKGKSFFPSTKASCTTNISIDKTCFVCHQLLRQEGQDKKKPFHLSIDQLGRLGHTECFNRNPNKLHVRHLLI